MLRILTMFYVGIIWVGAPARATDICEARLFPSQVKYYRIDGQVRKIAVVEREGLRQFEEDNGVYPIQAVMQPNPASFFTTPLRHAVRWFAFKVWNRFPKDPVRVIKIPHSGDLTAQDVLRLADRLSQQNVRHLEWYTFQIGPFEIEGPEFKRLVAEAKNRSFVRLDIEKNFGTKLSEAALDAADTFFPLGYYGSLAILLTSHFVPAEVVQGASAALTFSAAATLIQALIKPRGLWRGFFFLPATELNRGPRIDAFRIPAMMDNLERGIKEHPEGDIVIVADNWFQYRAILDEMQYRVDRTNRP